MRKLALLLSLFLCFVFTFHAHAQDSETLTLTTFYPSPFGVYAELRAQRMAIGEDYISSDYDWDIFATYPIDDQTDLVVEGKVGIGTYNPGYLLDVGQIGDYAVHFGNNTGNDFTVDIASGQGLVNLVAGAKVTDGTNAYEYSGTRGASRILLHDGLMRFFTSNSISGTAGAAVNWNTAMTVTNTGSVGIATISPSTGGNQDLTLDVEGPVGATHYCDENGNNCVQPPISGADLYNYEGGAAVKKGRLKILAGTVAAPADAIFTVSWTNTPFTNIYAAVASHGSMGDPGELGTRLISGSNNSFEVNSADHASTVNFIVVGD